MSDHEKHGDTVQMEGSAPAQKQVTGVSFVPMGAHDLVRQASYAKQLP